MKRGVTLLFSLTGMSTKARVLFILREVRYSKMRHSPFSTQTKWNLKKNWYLYMMLVPTFTILAIYAYYPMYGIIIAFQDYQPTYGFTGSPFVGFKWFRYLLDMPDFSKIINNTIIIAVMKISAGLVASITFALLLNEVRSKVYKKVSQTLVYLPHFLSWVIVGSIFIDLFSLDGIVNKLLDVFGNDSISFLGSNQWFRTVMVITDTWKGFGNGAILYLAALAGIDPQLYEAASLDGANRFQHVLYITLPGILQTIILVATLNLGNILNAGFEQIMIMYNPVVYETGDIIDTFVYRTGLMSAQFSLATAVGLSKSVVGFFLILLSYKLASRFANYRIF